MVKKNPFLGFVTILSAAGLTLALFSGVGRENLFKPHPWLMGFVFMLGLIAATFGARLAITYLRRAALRLVASMQQRLYVAGLLVILGLGLYLRLLVIWGLPIAPSSDFETYYQLGKHLSQGTLLLEGGGYRDYVAKFPHTIGFPMLVLYPVFSIFGASVSAALYANLTFCLGNILLSAFIGRRLGGRAMGLIAGALMAVWPSHVLYAGLVASEPSFTFCVLLAFYVAFVLFSNGEGSIFRRYPKGAVLLYLVPGALLAMGGAIRPMAVIALIALMLVLAFSREKEPGNGSLSALKARSLLCALVMLASYAMGSTLIKGVAQAQVGLPLVSGKDAFGYNVMVGVNTDSCGYWNEQDAVFFDEAYNKTGSAGMAHRAAMEVALGRIKDNPLGMLKLVYDKYVAMWQQDGFGVDWVKLFSQQQGILTDDWSARLMSLRNMGEFLYLWVLVLVLQLLPSVLRSPRREYITLLLMFLGTAALHMALETQVRYHYAVLPFFLLLASAAVCKDFDIHDFKEQRLPAHPFAMLRLFKKKRLYNVGISKKPES